MLLMTQIELHMGKKLHEEELEDEDNMLLMTEVELQNGRQNNSWFLDSVKTTHGS